MQLERGLVAVRDGWRGCRSRPGASLFIVAILSVALAAAAVVFSIVDAVLIRSLPFDDPDRLVAFGPLTPVAQSYSEETFARWSDELSSFESVGASFAGPTASIPSGSEVDRVRVWRISASLFDVLQVRPVLGRFFDERNERLGNHAVAVISYDLWTRYFGADQAVIGRRIEVGTSRGMPPGTDSAEIIGVAPPGFRYPLDVPPRLWMPYVRGFLPEINYLTIVGRIAATSSIADAQTELDVVTSSSPDRRGSFTARRGVGPVLAALFEAELEDVSRWMRVAASAVALLLIVGCINVAMSLLVRVAHRWPDLSVRMALGAPPGRLTSAVVCESLILTSIAAAIGLGLAWAALETVVAHLPPGIPRASDIEMDLRIWAVGACVGVASGLLAGIVPARLASKPGNLLLANQQAALQKSHIWQKALVSSELALFSALVVASAAVGVSVYRLDGVDLGFDRDGLFALRTPAPLSSDVLSRLSSSPNVSAVAQYGGGSPPLVMMAFGGSSGSIAVTRREIQNRPVAVLSLQVSPTYFSTARIPLRRGRPFVETEREGVVIVDEMASTLLFPDRDALNANLQLHGTGAQLQVVGIVASVRARGPAVDPVPHIYLPIADGAASGLLVRSAGAAHKVDTELRSLLTTIARDSSTTPTLYSIDDAYAQITTERRSSAWLLSTLCLVSLLVGLTGVYTAVSTMVTAQTEALRVRAAIGASRMALGAYVLRSAGKLILIGLVVGLPAGAIATGALSAVLFRTSANDAMIYVIAALVTCVVGFAASAGPALRTARTDPAGILRN